MTRSPNWQKELICLQVSSIAARVMASTLRMRFAAGDHLLGISRHLVGDPDEFAILGSLLLLPLPGGHALESFACGGRYARDS